MRPIECMECGKVAEPEAKGWRGYLASDTDTDDAPVTVFYCPECAATEFGTS